MTLEDYTILERLVIHPLQERGAKVWIFGSRATNKNAPFSDVDIMFEPSRELPGGFLFEIKSNIEESNFPYKVDLVERSELASSYRDRVESEKILIASSN